MTRVIAAALSVTRAGYDWSRVIKVAEVALTMIATISAVLLASFVAVAMGLS
jgi:hypothetical protein